ncbi:putative CocE/NonD family hydrolase [Sphingobium sp. B11D3B]|uniref:CocE/NonD family hydrolase n=1 Tax=Sphingobium sp. B11D3B TaxID=2940575 RepID=UPI0022278F47|nr:CocE/NonD family hydrolase [Sphingobium sp. B11D3B]MCW2388946.1 putative CocE/NonD family hydrolase [Sphingobium sp. B11D3B]
MDTRPPELLSMTTRDGVRLDADVYRPAPAGDYPVLLMRQPYGRRIATTVCFAHPAWYAAQGYIVVIQDVRGRGTSEGTFALFEQEAADGEDAINWAAGLPGSTGAVGMYGFSYQGVTQLLAAATLPPALRAIAPTMVGWDLRQDWAYENDAFCLAANIGWAVQLAAQNAKHAGDADAFADLAQAARALALGHGNHARPDILHRHARHVPFYRDWLDRDFADPYWARISPSAHADRLTQSGPPALFVTGWYDTHLPGTVAAYRAYEQAGRADAALVVGPWTHFPWGRRLGGKDFGEAAIGEIDQLQRAWFDQHLKGEGEAIAPSRAVRLFDMGRKAWRDFPAWPGEQQCWQIGSGGRAALDERDGVLAPDCETQAPADYLVHDPWRAVPTTGGAFGAVPGPVDRTDVDARPDVLTYTSPPMAAPVTMAGETVAALEVTADCPSFDLSCILTIVDEAGRSHHLSEGYAHFAVASDGSATVRLRPTCATIPAGARLRLAVSAASFPAYPINPGTGTRPVDAGVEEAGVITLRLNLAESRLVLPVLEEVP